MSQRWCRTTRKVSEKDTEMTWAWDTATQTEPIQIRTQPDKAIFKASKREDGLRILTVRELSRVSDQQVPSSSPGKMSL